MPEIVITYELLLEHGACLGQRMRFRRLFPEGASLTAENLDKAIDDGLDTAWLKQLCDPQAVRIRAELVGTLVTERQTAVLAAMRSREQALETSRQLHTAKRAASAQQRDSNVIDEPTYRTALDMLDQRYARETEDIWAAFNKQYAALWDAFEVQRRRSLLELYTTSLGKTTPCNTPS